MESQAKTTSWIIIGLGVAVAGLGWSLMPSLWGAGILGFGLAHVVLGILDTQRPTSK